MPKKYCHQHKKRRLKITRIFGVIIVKVIVSKSNSYLFENTNTPYNIHDTILKRDEILSITTYNGNKGSKLRRFYLIYTVVNHIEHP
ncbi:hypothetical protein C1631_014275 [Chryseobacterium phosphatilyticum]|uniref:Uncharacterized protein n=1 Tax=Chryseobacterium phosphatilyticum TaxID=475075 RepID=A0A316X6R6_9FLAO|nr:hypothetical protein C1631_014275 [Chryseobacterium phosphatilyticum]